MEPRPGPPVCVTEMVAQFPVEEAVGTVHVTISLPLLSQSVKYNVDPFAGTAFPFEGKVTVHCAWTLENDKSIVVVITIPKKCFFKKLKAFDFNPWLFWVEILFIMVVFWK